MHYSYEKIRELSTPVDLDGDYRVCVLALAPGDTAYAPGTTKYDLLAHGNGGTVRYELSPMDTRGYIVDGQVARALKAGRS